MDRRAGEAHAHPNADLILDKGVYLRGGEHEAENKLVKSLSKEQRQVLIRLLTQERASVLHDMLARLEWWAASTDLKITYKRKPVQPHESFHGDYVARHMGDWDWPTDQD